MTCPATPLPPATVEDAPLAPAVGDGGVALADEPDAGVSETPVAVPAPEAVPPVAGCVPTLAPVGGCVPTLAPVEGCIAEDPEVVEPEPVAAGRSVAPEGPGLAGAVDWASAVATRHAAISNFNIDDLPAGVSPGARRGASTRRSSGSFLDAPAHGGGAARCSGASSGSGAGASTVSARGVISKRSGVRGRVTSPSSDRKTRGRRNDRLKAGAVQVTISVLSRQEPMKAASPPRSSGNGTSPRTMLISNRPASSVRLRQVSGAMRLLVMRTAGVLKLSRRAPSSIVTSRLPPRLSDRNAASAAPTSLFEIDLRTSARWRATREKYPRPPSV